MDTKEYLTKIAEICKKFEKSCMDTGCPLKNYTCGAPTEPEKIDEVIKIVEETDLSKLYPFGCCAKCGYEFNSELISEYEIKYCPNCGKKIIGR